MSYQVHPYPVYSSSYDSQKNRNVYEQTSCMQGMSVKQLWMGQVLAAIAANPATMLDPEHHVDYAVKLVELAFNKMSV